MRIRIRNIIDKKRCKKITSAFLAATILVTGVPTTPFRGLLDFKSIKAEAANADISRPADFSLGNWYTPGQNGNVGNANIQNIKSLEQYSQHYFLHPEMHYKDIIDINLTSTNRPMPDFYGLGTNDYPFEGTIIISAGSANIFQIPEAFFDHISDKAIIQDTSGDPVELEVARTEDNTGEPAFAKHVHHYSENEVEGNGNWKVKISSFDTKDFDGNSISYNYNNAGMIGELLDGAKVSLDVTDNNGTATDVYATSVTKDVGYICGKLGENAELTVKSVSGSNTGYSISTTGGNSGGIVGAMDPGSKLYLRCAMGNTAPSITAANTAVANEDNNKYAGCLVGKNDGGIVEYQSAQIIEGETVYQKANTPYSVGGTVSAKAGSGGLFGYYKPVFTSNDYTYYVSDYTITATVNGEGSIGGLFGVLESEEDSSITFSTNDNTKKSASATHSAGDMTNFGGYIGQYIPKSGSSMNFDNVSASMTKSGGKFTNSYGGAIGAIASDTYVLFDGFTLTQATNPSSEGKFGGLVGVAGNSFIDTSGTTSISSGSFNGGGLVGRFDDGVLRLKGTVNISGTTCAGGGQIVGDRDDTLIYSDGCTITRKASPDEYDDIGSWGEVLRFGTGGLRKDDVLTENETTHIITIGAPVIAIGTKEAFAIDAICFSIKVGKTNGETDGNPWLTYASGASLNHENIVTTDLELSADVSLVGTGLTGLTRDSGSRKCTYQGEFDGNGRTLTLAIGDTSNGFNGKIYRHTKNGLFGVLSSRTVDGSVEGGTVKNVVFAGNVNVKAKADMCAGAAAAQVSGNFTATDVSVSTAFTHDGSSTIYLGRLVGEATSSIGTIEITNPTTAGTPAVTTYGKYEGDVTGANSGASSCFGGVIGKISADTGSKTWGISDVELSGEIKNTSSKAKQQLGGLIAYINSSSADKTSSGYERTLTLSGIKEDKLTIDGSATGSSGGMLGYAWYDTNVNVNGITIGGTTACNLKLTGAADLGGMVYCATGKWTIPSNGLTLTNLAITASNAKSFGMIINKGWNYSDTTTSFFDSGKNSAIYLLLSATNSYDCSGATITGLKTGITFDELVAYSAYYSTASNGDKEYTDADGDPYILKNGNGIVSIKTSSLNMSDSGASNTYQPQITQPTDNEAAYQNKWTRYYYNLDTIASGTGAPEKLMRWGLNQYAHKSLRSYFTNHFSNNVFDNANDETTATGYYNMAGYSWYPVDVNTNVKVQGTFKFANAEFEAREAANKVNSLATDKSSLSHTQHYMMHEGLFRNVTNSTVTLGNTTWKGTISKLNTPFDSEYGTGVLIFGTFVGNDKTTSKLDSSSGSIALDGIRVCNQNLSENGAYAPLLINKVGDYTKLTLKHIYVKNTGTASAPDSSYNSTSGSTTVINYAATSLIGNAGLSGSASNINFEFEDIKLDARSGGTPAGLDSVYPTKHSIFTKATLLNQFMYAVDSDATYNYNHSEDWSDATTHVSGNTGVTYGSELSDSTDRNQWFGDEHWYNNETHDASGKLTSPESGSLTGGASQAYDFSAFLPYVAIADTKANLDLSSNTEKKHQIRVNHASAQLTGCGTYNDPYMITQGDLEKIAKVINGSDLSAATFHFPILKHDVNGVLTEWEDGDTLKTTRWDQYGDQNYKYDGTNFRAFTGTEDAPVYSGTGYTPQVVRTYLAGAYYKLNDDITLSTDYAGLGATSDNYAVFRGVIIGSGAGKNKITNESTKPLVVSSNGSVIRNLDVYVNNTNISASCSNASDTYSQSDSTKAYGAVIGQVFGGDNIIDNVKVSFADDADTAATELGSVKVTGHLAPVGGYVGVVVNGAVIFRDMVRGDDLIKGIDEDHAFESDGTTKISMDSTKYLYVNPIVGRVLNGYVVNETTKYRPFENGVREYPDGSKAYCLSDGITYLAKSDTNFDSLDETNTAAVEKVTMQNGTKNYSIPDIDTGDTGKLLVGGYTKNGSTIYYSAKVTIADAQALFLFGGLIQSKATQSSDIHLANNDSYSSTYYKTTHIASYASVGIDTPGALPADTAHDYYKAVNDGYYGSGVNPYIVYKYANGQSGLYRVTNSYSTLNIQLGADNADATTFYLPDGFKGLGSYLVDNNYISLFELNGQGNTVSMGSSLKYYHKLVAYKTTSYDAIDNYQPQTFGFGFFNCLRQNREDTGFSTDSLPSIHDLTLSGNVEAQVYQTSEDISGYDYGRNHSYNHIGIVCVGGLAGLAGNGNKDKIFVSKVHLNNLSVFGAKTAGGLIGYIDTNTKEQYVYDCDGDELVVAAGQIAGGIVGVVANKNFNLDGKKYDSSNAVVKLKDVKILSALTGGDGAKSETANNQSNGFDSDKNRVFYAGGVIAVSKNAITINNVDVGVLDSHYSGFIGNINRENDTLNELSKNGTTYKGFSQYNGQQRFYNSKDKPWSIIGGIIGAVSGKENVTVQNCNVYNISMYGGFAAGIVARPEGAAYVYNCNVSSTQTAARMEATETTNGQSDYKITAWYCVGGLTGEPRNGNTIDGCSVSNYVLRCYSSDNDYNIADVGGLVGRSKGSAATIKNSSVENCYIEGRGKSTGDNDRKDGIGGIVGVNDQAIQGYNILIKDIKLLANNTQTMDTSSDTPFAYKPINNTDNKLQNGYVGAVNAAVAQVDLVKVKIVGFSLNITDPNNNTLKDPWYKGENSVAPAAGSYSIFADYANANASESTRSQYFSLVNYVNNNIISSDFNVTNDKLECLGWAEITEKKITQNNVTTYVTSNVVYHWGDTSVSDKLNNSFGNRVNTTENGIATSTWTRTIKKKLYDNSPYVTTANKRNIDSRFFLTGDAIVGLDYEHSVAKKIVDEALLPTIAVNEGDPTRPVKYYQDVKLSFPSMIGMGDTAIHALSEKPSDAAYTAMYAKKPSFFQDENGTPLAAADYPTYGEIYLKNLQSKFSTFKEASGLTNFAYDFPVLILDDANGYATTELLNNYLRILTNSNYDFANGNDYFDVKFAKCSWNSANNAFEYDWSSGAANLETKTVGTSNYFNIKSSYDNENGNGQFTLIDVAFKDPSSSATKYAYHLYVPVYVRKMLKFDFEVSSLSGTVYRTQPYEALRGNVLLENLESPVTLQFRWTYRRNLEDWVSQISGGEDLLQAFTNKKLIVEDSDRAGKNISELGFPDANMVLVDGSNYNKPYYANKALAYNNGELNLSSFTTDGTSGGTHFSPVELINFFDIVVSSSEPSETEANFTVKCKELDNSTGATIIVGNDYYRPWESGDTGTPSYLKFAYKEGMHKRNTDGDDYLIEDYYITFFTKKATETPEHVAIEKDTSIYHLVFSSPTSIGSIMPNDANSNGTSDVFLGNIFTNDFEMIGTYPISYEMNTASTSINAIFQAEIALSPYSKDIVKGFLPNSSVNIYQSFLINFEKNYLDNGIQHENGINAEPNVEIKSYIIDTENASGKGRPKSGDNDGGVDITDRVKTDENCEISVDNGTITNNYIELRNNENLKDYLRAAPDGIKIKTSFTLNYTGKDEADTKEKIMKQFPLRDSAQAQAANVALDQIGTKMLGSSNISPSNTATAYSKTFHTETGSTMYYTGLRSGVVMNFDSDDSSNPNGTYAQLGINSWNSSDALLPMKTLITYNVKNVDNADAANKMKLTLKLYRKGQYEIADAELPIAEYIDVRDTVDGETNTAKLTVKNKSETGISLTTDNTTSYVYQIDSPKTVLAYDPDKMVYQIPIDFSVYTGGNDNFENAKNNSNEAYKMYSNYMLKAEIVLYNGDDPIGGSQANDNVIYTNAKIYSDWIDNAS